MSIRVNTEDFLKLKLIACPSKGTVAFMIQRSF